MKALRIFICLPIFISCILGCQKKKIESEESNTKAAYQQRLTTKEQEAQEAKNLLEELRQINPFLPEHVSTAGQKEGGFGLKGIFWDDARPFAIMGDKVVVEGDSVDGKKVKKINRDSIILEDNGEEKIIKLKR